MPSLLDKDAIKRANPVERLIPDLLGDQVLDVGHELKIRCPWHDDKRPSLRLNVAKQLWCCDPCKKGGDVFDFVELYRQIDFPEALAFLAERSGHLSSTASRRTPEREHVYRDEAGSPRYKVIIHGRRPDGTKIVSQARAEGPGWMGGTGAMKDVRLLLYRLEALTTRRPEAVVIVEGEKDVDCAWTLGLPATCNVGGAGKWKETDTQQLIGAGVKRVRIIPDNDVPGRDHADTVARSCFAAGLEPRIVALPLTDKGADVSDYLATHSKDALVALLKEASAYEPPPPSASEPIYAASGDEAGIGAHPIVTCLADVMPEEVTWIWPGRIASRKLNLIVGDPGLGKSFITLDIVARFTTGRAWPDGAPAGPMGRAILLSAEDGLADTIRPRLDALGGNAALVHAVATVRDGEDVRGIQLADVVALERAILQTGAGLIVIDPVSAYLGEKDSHRDAEVRGLLAPLAHLAEQHAVTIIGVMHLSKNSQRAAIHRTIGSIAFVGAARVVLAVAADPDQDDRRFVAPIKNNLSAAPAVLAFAIPDGHLVWEPEPAVGIDINALLRGPALDQEERRESDDWLRELLADGPVLVKEIEREARGAGMSKSTVERAKARIHARAVKDGNAGPWSWTLPAKAVTAIGRPSPEIEGLREIAKDSPKALKSDSLRAFERPSDDTATTTRSKTATDREMAVYGTPPMFTASPPYTANAQTVAVYGKGADVSQRADPDLFVDPPTGRRVVVEGALPPVERAPDAEPATPAPDVRPSADEVFDL